MKAKPEGNGPTRWVKTKTKTSGFKTKESMENQGD
jgi:hypothetical protein